MEKHLRNGILALKQEKIDNIVNFKITASRMLSLPEMQCEEEPSYLYDECVTNEIDAKLQANCGLPFVTLARYDNLCHSFETGVEA